MTELYTLVKHHIANMELLNHDNALNTYKNTFLPGTFQREFRTISLGLPRRSGKTYTISKLADEYSSLTISKYARISGVSKNAYTLSSLPHYIGIRSKGLKYSCILLDEFDKVPEEVYEYIATQLRPANLITDNFFIVNLYTPVR